MSDVPIAPTRRRRHLWAGFLRLLVTVTGGVWWRTRLTSEERLFVGRWRYQIPTPQWANDEMSIEFRNDRTALANGNMLR